MKFNEIKPRLEKLIVFTLQDLYLIDPSFRQATLYAWVKKGWLIKLKNNCYVLRDFKARDYDLYLLSNQIYKPSYISLELALNHYGVIPEAVFVITAVSTKKTQCFENELGTFQYQSISERLYFGFSNIRAQDRNIQIATLEKSILDYLYLNSAISSKSDFYGLRWNKEVLTEKINWNELNLYLNVFNNKTLRVRLKVLKNYLEETNAEY
jgi:predicted transcriptional regulator of viral defense system